MPSLKKEELKNWTCDEVSWYAQSVISSEVFIDAFKAEELDGESLLDLPQNQMLMDDLVSAGLKSAHVRKLAKAVRTLVAPRVSPAALFSPGLFSPLADPSFPAMHMDRRVLPF